MIVWFKQKLLQVDRIQKDIDNKNAAISGYAVVANELGKLKTFTDLLSGTTAFAVSSSNTAIGVTVNDQSKAKTFDAKLAVSSHLRLLKHLNSQDFEQERGYQSR